MQSNPSPNLNNLNQFFNQFDSDHDGKVNDQEIQSIFKQIGYTDIYIGTIKKVIRLFNTKTPQNFTLDFSQVQQFAQSMITKGKFQIWKAKYQMQQSLAEIQLQLYGDSQDIAAPGASPQTSSGPGSPQYGNESNTQQGQISLNIGNNEFDQYIKFSLEKQKGKQIKPYVKISIEGKSQEQALKIQNLFKSIYDTFLQIVKAEQQEFLSEILSVSFITSVSGSIVNIFITTDNQDMIQLAQLAADFLDLMLKQPVNGKLSASYQFTFDFMKFISDPAYNFYDMLVKNCNIQIKWTVWDLFKNLRKIALKSKIFSDLKWNSMDPFCLFVMGFLHCQRFNGKLQFENSSSQNQQTASKEQLIEIFTNIKNQLKEFESSSQLNGTDLIDELDGKITIQAGIRDWKLNISVKLNNFSKLFTQDFTGVQQQENYD